MATTRHNTPASSEPVGNSPRSPTAGHAAEREADHEAKSESLPDSIESSIRGEDQPMEREHPRAPGALVMFSYPLALLAVLLIAAIVFIVIF